jgi:uncharacterized protein
MLKPSIYNIVDINENEEVLLVNGLRRKTVSFGYDESCYVRQLIECASIDYNALDSDKKTLAEHMLNDGFLVDENTDEILIADYMYNEIIFTNKPLHLTIIPSESCNLRCRYCYQDERHGFLSIEQSDLIIKFISQNIRLYPAVWITFFGGEPMLGFDVIVDFMKKLKAIAKNVRKIVIGSMSTNGTLLTADRLKTLVELGVIKYQICLDGFKEVHDVNRPAKNGVSSFEIIYKNLLDAKTMNKRFYITIRSNIVFKERTKVIEFFEQIKRDFLSDSRFRFMLQNVRDWGGEEVKSLDTHSLTEYNDIVNILGIDNVNLLGKSSEDIFAITGLCPDISVNSYYIDYDLSLKVCSLAKYKDDTRSQCNNIGYINSDGQMIINRDRFALWLQRKNIAEKCVRCKYYPFCYGARCAYASLIMNNLVCDDLRYSIDMAIKSLNNKKERRRYKDDK